MVNQLYSTSTLRTAAHVILTQSGGNLQAHYPSGRQQSKPFYWSRDTLSPVHQLQVTEGLTHVCPLCKKEPETVTHFLLHCPELTATRIPYLQRILNNCRNYQVSVDPVTLTKVILDTTHLPECDMLHEELCRNFVFKMHNIRAVGLGGNSEYGLARGSMKRF